MPNLIELIYLFFLRAMVFALLGSSSYAMGGCVQIGSSSLQPSVPDLSAGGGGMLSESWSSAAIYTSCSALIANGKYYNNVLAAGTDSGQTVFFEGVNYRLYKTNSNDVMYFGKVLGADNVTRPFGDFHKSAVSASATGTAALAMVVYVRFYSPSNKIPPGAYSISEQNLVVGVLSYNNSDPSINWGNWGMKSLGFAFFVKGITCSFKQPGMVKLRKVNLATLPAKGSSVEAGSLRLDVNCDRSMASYRVGMHMIDMYDPGKRSSNLSFVNSFQQSTGLALLLFDAGKPMAIGVSSNNLIGYMSASGGSISKLLDIRYTRIADQVMPGVGFSAVSVTLTND